MLRKSLVFLAVFGLLSIVWRKSFLLYFACPDEWIIFSSYASATGPEGLLKAFLTPHNEHFMPLFKLLFFFEYSLFGLNPIPYSLVSIGLFAISTMLLYLFLYDETKDRVSSFFCTAVYAINTAHCQIVLLLFLQEFILTFIFMELALIEISKKTRAGKNFSLIPAGIYCLLSSLSLSIGVTSWLFASIYYISKQKALLSHAKPKALEIPKLLLPGILQLLSPAIIYLVSHQIFAAHAIRGRIESFVLEPFLIIKGSVIILSDLLFKTFGINILFNPANIDFVPAATLEATEITVFITLAGFSLFLFRRLSREGRATMLLGFAIMLTTTILLIVARGNLYGLNFFHIANIQRYLYFPFIGAIIMAVPLFSSLRGRYIRRSTAVLSIALAILLLIHQNLTSEIASYYNDYLMNGKALITAIREELRNPGSRFVFDFGNMKVQGIPYKELLTILKEPDDIITELNNNLIVLKNYEILTPENLLPTTKSGIIHSGNKSLKISGAAGAALSIACTKTLLPTGFQHLIFWLKTDREVTGRLNYYCLDGETQKTSEFQTQKSCSYKQYIVPCPWGRNMELVLGDGNFAIKDIRLYN